MFKVGHIITKEEFKTIDGYPDYEVSNYGRVFSKKRYKFLKDLPTYSGYRVVSLSRHKVQTRFSVHRLVAKAFLPNPENLPFVCHIDDDRKNNRADNLAWGTPKQNSEDMVSKNRSAKGEKCGKAKLTKNEIEILRRIGSNSKFSHKQLAFFFNTTRSNITTILNNKTWAEEIQTEINQEQLVNA